MIAHDGKVPPDASRLAELRSAVRNAAGSLRLLARKVHDFDQLGPADDNRLGEVEADLYAILAELTK